MHDLTDNIPAVLRAIPHWVCWKNIERAGKKTKCPVSAKHGWNASSTDPNSWCTFDEALAAFQKSDTLAGVGFVFSTDDPFCGIDLDDLAADETAVEQRSQNHTRQRLPSFQSQQRNRHGNSIRHPTRDCINRFSAVMRISSPPPAIAYLGMQDRKNGLGDKWKPYLAYEPLEIECSDAELRMFERREESVCGMCADGLESSDRSGVIC